MRWQSESEPHLREQLFTRCARVLRTEQIPSSRRDTFISILLHYSGAVKRPAAPQRTRRTRPVRAAASGTECPLRA